MNATPFPRPRLSEGAKQQPHERRGMTTYKLATWNPRNACFNDGKRAYASAGEAQSAATKPGRYRLSEILDGNRKDQEPFEVA